MAFRTNKISLTDQSACTVFRGLSNQIVPRLTSTVVQLNVEEFDQDNEFDNAVNYEFKAKTAGLYLICWSVGFQPTLTPDKKFLTWLQFSGNARTPMAMLHSSHNDYMGAGGAVVWSLSVDETVKLICYHNCLASIALDWANGLTYMSVYKLG